MDPRSIQEALQAALEHREESRLCFSLTSGRLFPAGWTGPSPLTSGTARFQETGGNDLEFHNEAVERLIPLARLFDLEIRNAGEEIGVHCLAGSPPQMLGWLRLVLMNLEERLLK